MLTIKSLESIRDTGCRILVLNAAFFDSENFLCIEGDFGVCKKLSPDDLYRVLKPNVGKVNIDVIFINISNGKEIASVFEKLGV